MIQLRILKSKLINNRQKVLNSIFLWIIPFLWGLLVSRIVKTNDKTITKDQRKIGRFKFSDDWQRLTGFGGSPQNNL